VRSSLLAVVALAVLPSCSMIFVKSTGAHGAVQCSQRYTGPIWDTAIAVAAAAVVTGGSVTAVQQNNAGLPPSDSWYAGAAIAAAIAALHTVSAGFGYHWVEQCRDTRRTQAEWEAAHSPPAPPPLLVLPAPLPRKAEPAWLPFTCAPQAAYDETLRQLVLAGVKIDTHERVADLLLTELVFFEADRGSVRMRYSAIVKAGGMLVRPEPERWRSSDMTWVQAPTLTRDQASHFDALARAIGEALAAASAAPPGPPAPEPALPPVPLPETPAAPPPR